MSNPAFEFVRQLGQDLANGDFDLPPFPDTALRIRECINDPDVDIPRLAGVVAGEPALAARLLRMSNSAMMRRGPIEVTDINTAISRVGMDMVQNVAMSFAAREAFKAPANSPCSDALNQLRQESIRVASLSYVIGRNYRFNGKPDEAMLAGLLHTVGKLYIVMKAADHPELFADKEALSTLQAQWHTGVARAIVESWEFPESIAQGVDEQELAERDRIATADISDILFLSNLLSRAGIKAAPELGDLDALARLRTDPVALAEILEQNQEEVESMSQALGS
jgi:HD-like signal output (HDOD) protein